jgi:hypothetical protein
MITIVLLDSSITHRVAFMATVDYGQHMVQKLQWFHTPQHWYQEGIHHTNWVLKYPSQAPSAGQRPIQRTDRSARASHPAADAKIGSSRRELIEAAVVLVQRSVFREVLPQPV